MSSDEFFVGYLPVPTKLRRWLFIVATVLILLVGGIAVSIAVSQRDPGNGQWHVDKLDRFEGTLIEHPYPMLQTRDSTMLLILEGKHGAAERVAGMHGKRVSLQGHTLVRGELKLLELDDSTITERATEGTDAITTLAADQIKLTGEIIDPKCFSGAMKPGEGKTHKACAVLCLRGGIPPVFLNSDGSTYLLVDRQSGALSGAPLDLLLPFVGDQVEISAHAGRVGQLRTLCIENIARR